MQTLSFTASADISRIIDEMWENSDATDMTQTIGFVSTVDSLWEDCGIRLALITSGMNTGCNVM